MVIIAQSGLLILLSLFLVLHLLILVKIIPYRLVWGGRLKSEKEMYRFEIFSILVTSLLIVVVLVHGNILSVAIPKKVVTIALWLMAGLFLLNTVGNAVSKNGLEQRFFTPATILLTIFSACLAWAS